MGKNEIYSQYGSKNWLFKLIHSILKILAIKLNNSLCDYLGIRIKFSPTFELLHKKSSFPHKVILPFSSYSPWTTNKKFQSVFKLAKKNTLVDEYRLYELHHLASQALKFGGDFIEIGVWRGGSSAIIANSIKNNQRNIKLKPTLYIADTFNGVAKAGSKYDNAYTGGEHSNASIEDVKKLFAETYLKLPIILKGIFPDDHPNLNIPKISFIHSDVDAYKSTKDVIRWCLPRLTTPAIIIFDDYGFSSCEGVTKFVNEFMRKNNKKFTLIHNLNGHAIIFKHSR